VEYELRQAQDANNKDLEDDVVYEINNDSQRSKAFLDAQAVAASEGLELVVFDTIGGADYCNGFYASGSKWIFINSLTYDRKNYSTSEPLSLPTVSEMEQYVSETFVHEYTHYFEHKSPELFRELIDLAISFEELDFNKFSAENEKNIARYAKEVKLSENISDFVATYLTRQDFWEYLAYKNKELCEVMQYTLKEFSERTQRYIATFATSDQQRERVLTELRQLEEHILKLHEAAYTGKGKGTGASEIKSRLNRLRPARCKHKARLYHLGRDITPRVISKG